VKKGVHEKDLQKEKKRRAGPIKKGKTPMRHVQKRAREEFEPLDGGTSSLRVGRLSSEDRRQEKGASKPDGDPICGGEKGGEGAKELYGPDTRTRKRKI